MISTNDPRLQEKLAERRRLITQRQAQRRSRAHERVCLAYGTAAESERAERGAIFKHQMPLADCIRAYVATLADLVPPAKEARGKSEWRFETPADKEALADMEELLSGIPAEVTSQGLEMDHFIGAYMGGEGGDNSRSVTSRVGRMIKKLGWTKRYLYREGKYVYLYFPPAKQYGRPPSTVEQC